MKRTALITSLASAVLAAAPASANPSIPSPLQRGFAGAVTGCEEWILNPSSWANGTAPFQKKVGLGQQMGLVADVDQAALPPPQLRKGNHYWRINSTIEAGYILVVSDALPMCHITGGGDADLQPAVEMTLASADLKAHWESLGTTTQGEMKTSSFRNRRNPDLTLVINRANAPAQRRDHVQVLATGLYEIQRK